MKRFPHILTEEESQEDYDLRRLYVTYLLPANRLVLNCSYIPLTHNNSCLTPQEPIYETFNDYYQEMENDTLKGGIDS